jgi:hypothetical protein
MERHHAAERHLYPGLLPVLQEIRDLNPNVIIGAVTDGRANPLFMTFTLAPYFDFCMSWEDDQGNRQKFFKELGSVGANVELKWIYDAALEKYQELAAAQRIMQKGSSSVGKNNKRVVAAAGTALVAAAALMDGGGGGASPQDQDAAVQEVTNDADTDTDTDDDDDSDPIWIHVGDDLAYDVGGAALSGAKTIYVELADQYGQTARHRFDDIPNQPAWSTTMQSELRARKVMNDAAVDFVDCKINFLTRLPEAITEILQKE